MFGRNPFKILNEDFESIFGNMFDSIYKSDNEGNMVLELEVPGFNKDNLQVEIADGLLTIQGENGSRKVFKRYTIGNVEDVKANIKDGLLTLTLIEAQKQVKRIEFQTPAKQISQ